MDSLTVVEGAPGEGRVPATLKLMKDDEAVRVSELITNFCFSIAYARIEVAKSK